MHFILIVYHVEKNIKNRFKTDTNGHIWKAAKALTRNDFYRHMNNLKNDKGMEMFNYLSSISLETWASAYFTVPRFGHVTSNIAESINLAIGDDIRKKAPFFILVEITRKITQTIV